MRIPLLAVALDVLELGVLLLAHHCIEEYGDDIADQRHEEGQPAGTAQAEENKDKLDSFSKCEEMRVKSNTKSRM